MKTDIPVTADVTLYLGQISGNNLRDLCEKVIELLQENPWGITASMREVGESPVKVHLGTAQEVGTGLYIDGGDTSYIIWDAGRYWSVRCDTPYPICYPLHPGERVEVGPLERSSWWETPPDPPHDLELREFHRDAIIGEWDGSGRRIIFREIYELEFHYEHWIRNTAVLVKRSDAPWDEGELFYFAVPGDYSGFREAINSMIDIVEYKERDE